MTLNTTLYEVPWETRNLKRPAYELVPEMLDSESIGEALKQLETAGRSSFFIQAKTPVDNKKELRRLQDLGFRFAEMSLDPWLNIGRSKFVVEYQNSPSTFLPEWIDPAKFRKQCMPTRSLSANLKKDITKIATAVFKNDRFHMDPSCPERLANERIGLWINEDLFVDVDARCTMINYDRELAGFMMWKGDRLVLGGAMNPSFLGKGLAKSLYLASILDVLDDGSDELSSTISAVNIEVLNLYSRLGFSFRKPTCVLHYWG